MSGATAEHWPASRGAPHFLSPYTFCPPSFGCVLAPLSHFIELKVGSAGLRCGAGLSQCQPAEGAAWWLWAQPPAPPPPQVPEAKEEGSAHLAVPGVCFTCPLTGATLRKDQRDAHIKEAILSVSGSAGPAPGSWVARVCGGGACVVSLERQRVRGVRNVQCPRAAEEKPPLAFPSWRRPL